MKTGFKQLTNNPSLQQAAGELLAQGRTHPGTRGLNRNNRELAPPAVADRQMPICKSTDNKLSKNRIPGRSLPKMGRFKRPHISGPTFTQ